MKSQIVIRSLLSLLLVITLSHGVKAQVILNPGEWLALAEGNDLINSQIQSETKSQLQTATLQNTMAAEFNQIKKWESKYSSYLQTASGYASILKAGTILYHDGVHIFITLGQLRKAVQENPQGMAATLSMNNLYVETATELISVFTLLNETIAKGGNQNMLTGAERSQTLWELQDRLGAFSKKLHYLYLSIRYYNLNDVWNRASAGMIDRSNAEVAGQAYERWRRAAKVIR